ncbi:hypothetical protein F4775DRAFT_576396, partial [Biscogniauxia sp. FL1348]
MKRSFSFFLFFFTYVAIQHHHRHQLYVGKHLSLRKGGDERSKIKETPPPPSLALDYTKRESVSRRRLPGLSIIFDVCFFFFLSS